ncbi:phage/plasmid primase, P4 family [Haloglomus salinum]|uniref:phage/plasmid primase, P4 family n=1 Tax=Haloglomus salinum TaxID=2962673 RepID=UPI0020C9F75E|nr:phage/plasmid primase, P4 family [Haloglomus salinum]
MATTVSESDRQILRQRLAEVGSADSRFIPVEDGSKASKVKHTDARNRVSSFDSIQGNYGVYAGGSPENDRWLIDVDIDDYDDDADDEALEAVNELPETLTVKSPHTDGVTGGHRYYCLPGEVPEILTSLVDPDDPTVPEAIESVAGAKNPNMSWGEIRVKNQYVVGPGSQLDGCDKEWCDDCSKPDGGRYEIADDRPIAEISLAELFTVLRADESDEEPSQAGEVSDVTDGTPEIDGDESHARAVAEHYSNIRRYLMHGSDDRSESDFHVCCRMIEHGVDESEAYRLLANNSQSKVDTNDGADDYWRRTWQKAKRKVGSDENTETLPQRRADGDMRASNPTPGGDRGEESTDSLSLSPSGVIQAALADPHGRLERADDPKDNPTVHDLRKSEAATYVWQVMNTVGRDDVRAVKDNQGATTELRGYNDGIWRKNGEQKLREYSRQALQSAHSSNIVGELEEEVRSRERTQVRREALGAPDGTVAVANGLLHLLERDGPQLEELEREHYAIRQINAEYDPDAPAPNLWLDHLERCVRDEQDRKRLQEYFGYTLWHHSQPFGKALFLLGPTDSGKGTAIKVLENVLGTENVAHEALGDLVDGRWGPAGLYESVANVRDEVTAGALKNVERFKELTGGGDTITAEFKNQDKFEFPVYQKFVYATNTIPTVKNADKAFYNRCLFVKFPNTIPESEQETDYHDRLLEERSGILNWMLDGLRRLMDQGKFTGERTITDKKAICDAFGNVTDRFVHNCLEVVDDSDVITHKKDMLNLAQAYAEQVDMDSPWDSQQGFTEDLKSYSGISDKQSKRITGDNTRVFSGVKPRAEAVEAANVDVRYDDPRQESNQEQLG